MRRGPNGFRLTSTSAVGSRHSSRDCDEQTDGRCESDRASNPLLQTRELWTSKQSQSNQIYS